jgi:hypothetical protein
MRYFKRKGMGTVLTTAGFTSMVQHYGFEKGRYRYMELYKKIEKEIVRIKQKIK